MADWQVGDLALCVESARGNKLYCRIGNDMFLENGDRELRIKAGAVYTVTNVGALIGPDRQLALGFTESEGPWLASRFRKITPGAKIAGIEEPRRIKAPKPVREDA